MRRARHHARVVTSSRSSLFVAALSALLLPAAARAAAWEDATMATIGVTAEWSNKVELADIDGDGRVDILFANGAGYSAPEAPEMNRAFLNQGPGKPFLDVSAAVFGATPDYTRAIKARDLDGDGHVDLLVANTFESQSRLYLGDGKGGFAEATDGLPQGPASFGDVELGDVDGDGDLDAILADWGPGDAASGAGRTRLWLGDGVGGFTDATETNMPDVLVGWSWELELADVDNDFDLDALVSCKACDGSFLFENDGAGVFTDVSDRLPQFGNNYEFEPIDLDADGFVDLVTINDGPQAREHVFLGDGKGGFVDATAELWPKTDNIAGDDNMVAFLDADSDGDPDFVIAGLFGNPDRLIRNDGHLVLAGGAFSPDDSSGSLGIAVADLDGDKKIDVVMSEGESPENADRVFLGVDVPADTAAPVVTVAVIGDQVYARIHDNKTPVMPHDFQKVVFDEGGGLETPMRWYGEALWRLSPATSGQVCAVDAAGNQRCVAVDVPIPGETGETGGGMTSGATSDGTGGGPTTACPPPPRRRGARRRPRPGATAAPGSPAAGRG